MAVPMVKTSVTVPRSELEAAQRLGINVSALLREALLKRVREELLDREVTGYAEAFAEWDESPWDHLSSEGLADGSAK